MASDQGLHCLLAGISIQHSVKAKNSPELLKLEMVVVVIVDMLMVLNVHGKQLRSCRDGQLS